MAPQLWLLRHGEAEPHGSRPDHDRPLTARGERQSAAAGAALARLGLELTACYTSPKLRARETARLACESLGVTPEVVDELSDGFDVDVAAALLARHADADPPRLLLVGHNPDFAQVVHDLTGGRIDFKKGAVAAIGMDGGRRGEILALLRPRELETLALTR